MAGKRNERKPRAMKRAFLVICEGQTEEAYIDFLRQRYRSPIKIIAKVSGGAIDNAKVRAYQNDMKISRTDNIKTFLMYDLDVPAVAKRIATISAEKLLSNPCIELWFLLHTTEIRAELNTKECIDRLKKSAEEWTNYKKSALTQSQKNLLWNNREEASKRAQILSQEGNPSSTVYRLINELESNRS